MSTTLVFQIGLTTDAGRALAPHLASPTVETLTFANSSEMLARADGALAPALILVGADAGDGAAEVAQASRMVFGRVPTFFVCERLDQFDASKMRKNGFTDVFLIPMDLKKIQSEIAAALGQVTETAYARVQLVDIEPDSRVSFDIVLHLRANDKYVRYVSAGETLSASRRDRLIDHNKNSILVPEHQLPRFYTYAADRLEALGTSSSQMSETERERKLQSSVRSLIGSVLSESYARTVKEGKQALADTRRVVEELIERSDPDQLYRRLKDGHEAGAYEHGQFVATLAPLFGMVLGVGTPLDLGLAGLMHDIGIAALPAELQSRAPADMSAAELEAYQQHPRHSVRLLQERKMILPTSVLNAIAQHHERWSGGGYPQNVPPTRMSPEAQVLALADRFDELTQGSASPLSPEQAIVHIENEGTFNPAYTSKLKQLWKPTASIASKAS